MKALINDLVEILGDLRPALSPNFLPPVRAEEIAAAETELGLQFPDDLKQFYAAANGQDFLAQSTDPLFPAIRFRGEPKTHANDDDIMSRTSPTWFNSVSELISITNCLRQEFDDLAECVDDFEILGPARYHDRVLGFTTTENSDSLVIDLDPEPGGNVGQVVMVRTQPFEIAVIASDLSTFLTMIRDGYRDGRFVFDKNWGWMER
ncbi:MAG: SMI1/KNR4 family protein [Planctomycetaceae bacterium]|nr:SMI1/KNR4 family protein [Planctomycetaceae bacterium]